MAFADLIARVDRAAQSALGGEVITYAPAIAPAQPPGPGSIVPPASPVGIFDERYVLDEGDANAGVEARGPAVFLRLADLPVDPEVDDPTIIIRGISYRVIERRRDDMGGILLVLRVRTS